MRTHTHPQRLFIGIHVAVFLGLLLTACGNNTSSGSRSNRTLLPGTAASPPNVQSAVSGDNIPRSEQANITLGPQACPEPVKNPSHWDSILGTSSGINKVESVSCANILGDTSLQAMVTVRYADSDAQLDVYVYTNLTNAQPKQIFAVHGLVKGDARISLYNTLMTAEVDKNSTLNADRSIGAMTQDLFREFEASADKTTLIQTIFPGIFPDLTRYQAEADQVQVNQGNETWKNDAAQLTRAMVSKFFGWKRAVSATVTSGGGPHDLSANVSVSEKANQRGQKQGSIINVELSRLEGNSHNMWTVIAVQDASSLSITTPVPLSLVRSPLKIEGNGTAFKGNIGRAVVYDHLYTDIGHARITSQTSMGISSFSTTLLYNVSFLNGNQEGILAVYEANGGMSNEIETAVMMKVLLNPQSGQALGALPCPDNVQNPAYWDALLPLPRHDAQADSVSCGNLIGDSSLQALVSAHLIGCGPAMYSFFVFDNISDAHPKVLFQLDEPVPRRRAD